MQEEKHISPKVTIIIPVYNVEKYIEECLDSVAEQTTTALIECILVDDCGKDSSVAIAERWIGEYNSAKGKESRIKNGIEFRMLHHEHNKGLSAARNTAIREAKGEYVYFLDSDDKLFSNSMDNLLRVAEKHPDAEIILGSLSLPWYILSKDVYPEYSNDVEWIRNGLCTITIPDPGCNKLTKREFIIKNNLFFVEGYLQEDTIWNYQVQKHISAFAFCYEVTYWYRYNPEGIMNGMSAEREAKSFAKVFKYAYEDLMQGERIEPYEIKYLIWNAKRVFGYIGKNEGNKLLVTQNNPLFNKALKWSTGLSRVKVAWLREMLLGVIKCMVLDPTIKKLCKKENLGKNYTEV